MNPPRVLLMAAAAFALIGCGSAVVDSPASSSIAVPSPIPTADMSRPASTPAAALASELPLSPSPADPCTGWSQTLENQHFDPTLEAMFPSTVDGHGVDLGGSQSYLAFECARSAGTEPPTNTFGARDPSTISFALGYIALPGLLALQAWRFPGEDAWRMLQGGAASPSPSLSPSSSAPPCAIDVPGRLVPCGTSGGSYSYFYPVGDTLFYWTGGDQEVATEIVNALPAQQQP